MTARLYKVKLSKGSVILLDLIYCGHVWRDAKGFWTDYNSKRPRNVHLRVIKLEHHGMVTTRHDRSYVEVTAVGKQYLADNPVTEILPE